MLFMGKNGNPDRYLPGWITLKKLNLKEKHMSMKTFTPLVKKRYSDIIAGEIQTKILKGYIKFGERLPTEHDLAGEFNVSRSVVREAIRILDGLGLVLIKKGPRGGMFASNNYHKPVSNSLMGLVDSGQASVNHVFHVRLIIEPKLAYGAAENATDEDIANMGLLLSEMKKIKSDPAKIQVMRGEFQILLSQASCNPVLEIFTNSLINLLREYFRDFKDLEFEKKAVVLIEKIFHAIKNKEATLAEALMTDYINKVRDLVLKLVE